ncbi:MAG TPA: acetate--CoA ligase family protein [Thermoflexia bacterium]|nr:acetate--CoA ligase family protein [Thermoflexia bacterium]
MDRFFYPQSIVVIGVSEKPDNLARNILTNLRTFGYRGDLYAVGRQEGEVEGVPIVTSLDQLPDGIDLAVILTPAPTVPDLMEACGRKSIRRVVIESGGFGEFSEEGRLLEQRLLEVARRWGIRFVGPNCISVVNLETGVCLPFAPLSPEMARRGRASVVSQSGGVSITYLDRLSAAGVGVNKVVSIGNKTDLDETDYLAYLLGDPGTEIVVLYLESLSDGRRLLDLARSASKPIVVHKANRGEAGQRIAASHTAALADDDRIVSAAFRQVGILRAEGFRDAVAMVQGLSLPPVRGDHLVVISRSGGHAVIAADAAEAYGFQLPPLPEAFARRVRGFFRADVIAPTNPLDLGVIFDFDLYARIVEECLRSLAPDAILLVNTYGPTEMEGGRRLARKVESIVRETGLPVALCVYAPGEEARRVQEMVGLPVFTEIDEAMRGLAAARDWHRWQSIRAPSPTYETAEPTGALHSLPTGTLTTDQALTLCQAYGIPVAPWERASTPEGAATAADRLGYPVALKVLSPEVIHKTDVGGVVLGLAGPEVVREAAERVLARAPEGASLMVQRMVKDGIEVILGGKQDPTFGPVVMFGLGGIYVEVLGEVSFRVAPLTRFDAESMIDEVRSSRLLGGVRGSPPADREGLVRALLALSRLMLDHPRLLEIDVNPLIVSPEGVVAVDARARVE